MAEAEDLMRDMVDEIRKTWRRMQRLMRGVSNLARRRQQQRAGVERIRDRGNFDPNYDRRMRDVYPDPADRFGEVDRQIAQNQQLRMDNDRLQAEVSAEQQRVRDLRAEQERDDIARDPDDDGIPVQDDVDGDGRRDRDELDQEAQDNDLAADDAEQQREDGDEREDGEQRETDEQRETEDRQTEDRETEERNERDRRERDGLDAPAAGEVGTAAAAAGVTAEELDDRLEEDRDLQNQDALDRDQPELADQDRPGQDVPGQDQAELNGQGSPEAEQGSLEAEQGAELGDDDEIRPRGQEPELDQQQEQQPGLDQQPELDQQAEQGQEAGQEQGDAGPQPGLQTAGDRRDANQVAQQNGQSGQDGEQVGQGAQQAVDESQQPGQSAPQPVEEPLLDEQRQARQQQHSNGQEQTADTSASASVDDLKAQHERVSAGHAAASGATRQPGEAALAGGRGGQTAGRQHTQDMNRGGGSNRTDGPGYER